MKPVPPVLQKTQPTGHPTCEETQAVTRPGPGRRTLSMASPSRSGKTNFEAPSSETALRTGSGLQI
ncbi:MAG: hypothetical protein BWX47_00187 [candidate division Hyd24-12 bacterium ADurb.Bin004]|nr:MAG: hypothetical protein BWX47_00187 [candidate division Hyd24-12 bacterium ADurb.Bin004]